MSVTLCFGAEWVGPLPAGRGRWGACDSDDRLRCRCESPNRAPPKERVEAISEKKSRTCRRLRFTAAEIAGVLGMALSQSVSGWSLLLIGSWGRLGRLGLEPPCATSAPGPASRGIDAEKSWNDQGGAGHRVTGAASIYQPTVSDRGRQAAPEGRLRVCALYRNRRPQPSRLRRSASPSERPRSAFSTGRLVSSPGTASVGGRPSPITGPGYLLGGDLHAARLASSSACGT